MVDKGDLEPLLKNFGIDVLNPAFCRTRRLTMTSNAEEQKSTGWLPHSVRGFLSGTVS